MVIMANYCVAPNSIRELWNEIGKCHLSYLDIEESPGKIEQRIKLEEYIHDFLCVAANSQKFAFSETQEVLQRSAIYKKDFSAYKAATGFNAVQLYAANLLSQPWRKEYRQIKTYCGFYRHQIEANLVGAERMFQAMGYQQRGERLLVLEGPICPDRVEAVSRDCLIAYVECQILKVIWEELSTSFKISWLEVLEFRKNHSCSPEQAIRALKYKQRQYQDHTRSYSQGCDPLATTCCQPVPISTIPPVILNQSYPPHHTQGFQFPPGYCPNTYPPLNPGYTYMTYAEASSRPNLTTNGYYNGFVPPQLAGGPHYSVPTGKLIEVEPHYYDTVNRRQPRQTDFVNNEVYKGKTSQDHIARNHVTDGASDKNDAQFEDWDYVYRNLETQGYSKDLGERGDLLSPTSKAREMKKIKATNLDEVLNNLSVHDTPTKTHEVKGPELEPDPPRVDKESSPASSYDNLVRKSSPKGNSLVNYVKTKTLPRDKTTNLLQPSTSKTVEKVLNKDDKSGKRKMSNKTVGSGGKWECKTCTYLNEAVKEICEMCGKSRSATSEPPIEIGGAECSKCTLVNPKNKTVCEACNASLVGSPTYI